MASATRMVAGLEGQPHSAWIAYRPPGSDQFVSDATKICELVVEEEL